jgi:hypothetical protein
MGDPHAEQKLRNFAGVDSYSLSNASPDRNRKDALEMVAFDAKAEPLARRQ